MCDRMCSSAAPTAAPPPPPPPVQLCGPVFTHVHCCVCLLGSRGGGDGAACRRLCMPKGLVGLRCASTAPIETASGPTVTVHSAHIDVWLAAQRPVGRRECQIVALSGSASLPVLCPDPSPCLFCPTLPACLSTVLSSSATLSVKYPDLPPCLVSNSIALSVRCTVPNSVVLSVHCTVSSSVVLSVHCTVSSSVSLIAHYPVPNSVGLSVHCTVSNSADPVSELISGSRSPDSLNWTDRWTRHPGQLCSERDARPGPWSAVLCRASRRQSISTDFKHSVWLSLPLESS